MRVKIKESDGKFQFQYGAIISRTVNGFILTTTLFQFQYGAIISPQRC